MRHDVFIGLSMSSIPHSLWQRRQDEVCALVDVLETHRLSVYCAARETQARGRFSSGPEAIARDIDALKHSHIMVAFYLEPTNSSLLVEIGVSIAHGTPLLLFARQREHIEQIGLAFPRCKMGRLTHPRLYVSTQAINPFNGATTSLIRRFTRKYRETRAPLLGSSR
ncbi:hypothetical protein HYW18_01395 [Candidatus Uhrbacteria bacterium]|nr:hypothetical protein [Candidatus Uhrbacteria bacterium]